MAVRRKKSPDEKALAAIADRNRFWNEEAARARLKRPRLPWEVTDEIVGGTPLEPPPAEVWARKQSSEPCAPLDSTAH
jgi:hypothetical protein